MGSITAAPFDTFTQQMHLPDGFLNIVVSIVCWVITFALLSIAVRRTQAFGSKRKILAVSTPTIEGASRIEALYKQSDQRKFFVPCPRCDHFQVLVWAGVAWEPGKPETARYRCESCEGLIENHEKDGMLARGEWRAMATGDGKTAGFHICALYAPVGWPSWAELAGDFLEANKSKETLQTFVNTILGETWRDEAAASTSKTPAALLPDPG